MQEKENQEKRESDFFDSDGEVTSEEEEKKVKERLRALGYLD